MYLIKFQCSLWFSELIFDKVGNHKFKLARLARFEHSKCEIFHRNSGSFWYVIKVANFLKRRPVQSIIRKWPTINYNFICNSCNLSNIERESWNFHIPKQYYRFSNPEITFLKPRFRALIFLNLTTEGEF